MLALLNTSNAPLAPSKRKAAPTCSLSLATVSLSGTQHGLSVIPFPSTEPTAPSSAFLSPHPRVRTQASPLRRRRSLAPLVQPPRSLCSSPAESEPEQVSPSPPRKRARKAVLSSPSPSPSTSPSPAAAAAPSCHHSLALSQRKPKASRKAAADLRFMCTVYRSLVWTRATRGHSNTPDTMDIDVTTTTPVVFEAQESVFASRLRSYLIFNEMNPQCLDLAPIPDPFCVEDNMDVDVSSSAPSIASPFQPPWPIMTPEQVTASLLFRFRHRSKGKSRPEAALGNSKVLPVKTRKPSPLAGPGRGIVGL